MSAKKKTDYDKQLDGLEFLPDGAPPTTTPNDGAPDVEDAGTLARANQDAAKAAIRKLESDPKHSMIRPVPVEMTQPRMLTPEEAARELPKRHVYRVVVGGEVARGASKYVLRPGKVISENEYDIRALQAMGMRLEELTD